MSKQTTKGPKGTREKKEAAFTRHAAGHSMQQKQFVGDAGPERAAAEQSKNERVEEARTADVVREMADRLEEEAGVRKPAGLRMPKSLKDGVELLNTLREPETREQLREKARERLEELPAPVRFALGVAERATGLVMKPVQKGVRLIAEALRVPSALFKTLTRREA